MTEWIAGWKSYTRLFIERHISKKHAETIEEISLWFLCFLAGFGIMFVLQLMR